ncbi:MAG: hypothetical protein GC139_10470 [Sideroxydans sp.]|nr:hypothetical protein [Sideroxydans sp.]
MKKYLVLLLLLLAGCGQSGKESEYIQNPMQPSFRDRYNALAKIMAPSLMTRQCVKTKNIGRNHDVLIECPLIANGAQLTISGLNNLFTGALLELDVQQLENPADLMNAGKILLRLARDKDGEKEPQFEMTQFVIEAQQRLGKAACEKIPDQNTLFCIMTNDKKIYHLMVE